MATQTDNLVTSWKLDVSNIEKNTGKAAKKLDSMSKRMNKGMADIQAGMSIAAGVAQTLGRAWDELATRGAQLDRLQRNNTLSIVAATRATKGYVTQVELLKSSNMAVAFDLGFTDEQFAKVAKSAVIMSQKLGTDATQAINDVIVGLSRQSKKILDNLGIMVSVNEANEEYAASLGRTVKSLSDAEKKTAFMNATMKELDRLTKGATLSTNSAGDQYEILKNQLSDNTAEVGKAIIQNSVFLAIMSQIAKTAGDAAKFIKFMSDETKNLGNVSQGTAESLKDLWDFASDPVVAGILGIAPATVGADIISKAGTGESISKRLSDALKGATSRRLGSQLTKNIRGEISADKSSLGASMRGGGFSRFKAVQARRRAAARKKRKKRKRSGVGRVDPLDRDTAFDIDTFDDSDEQRARGPLDRGEAFGFGDAAKSINSAAEQYQIMRDRMRQAQDAQKRLNAEIAAAPFDSMRDAAMGFGFSMMTITDAALQGKVSFAEAMLSMLKSTLFSLSQQAAMQAIFNYGKAAEQAAMFNPVGAALHTTAANTFVGLSVAAGAAGLGISVAQSVGGGSAGAGAARSSAQSGNSSSFSPSFSGTRRSDKNQPINIQLFLGDPGDPSAALMVTKQVQAQLAAR